MARERKMAAFSYPDALFHCQVLQNYETTHLKNRHPRSTIFKITGKFKQRSNNLISRNNFVGLAYALERAHEAENELKLALGINQAMESKVPGDFGRWV